MKHLRNLLKYAIPYKNLAIGHIVSNIFYALFGALSFVALIPMLDILFKPQAEGKKTLQEPIYTGITNLKDYGKDYLEYQVSLYAKDDAQMALMLVIVLIISLFLLKNIFGYLANYFMVFLRNGIVRDLRNNVYSKTIELPLSYFSEQRKGDILSRVTNDVNTLQYSMLPVLELIAREPLMIIFTILAMLLLSAKLTLFVFIFIPLSGIIISRIGKSLKRKSDRVQREIGVTLSILEETLTGLRIIKGFNAEGRFNKRFQESTSRAYHFSNKLLNRQNLASPISEFLGILVISILLWYGGQLVLVEQSLDGSTFIAYMGLAYNIMVPAKAISRGLYNIKQGSAAAERIEEIINAENPLVDIKNPQIITDFKSKVEFKDVSFKYEKDYVLRHFSLSIPKGQTIALVGQSGSGKSTIANLITRFYDVNEGEILIDGTNIKNLLTTSLRQQIGLVTQDAILFNDSVANNLRIGKPDATEVEMIEALKVANAWEFVKELPDVLNFNIGDGGGKLSGGQKQRLSIARAVLKNPPIMVLDEATSALDTESERLVQLALENMMKHRTSVVIAHRLSTIQNADLIVVLQKGNIVEQGTHKELLAKQGVYQKLVEMQSFD
jgi:subfamily B ATP-binding cassette protein MsbA